MRAAWIVVGLGVAAAAAATAVIVAKGQLPEFEPAASNREIVPDTVAAYLEVNGLGGLYEQAKLTEAWIDLGGSELVERVREQETVKAFLDGVAEVSQRADYEIDDQAAMKFVGRSVSLGIELPASPGAKPSTLLVTKLDVDALTRDLLTGKADWRALQAELNKRTESLDFQVVTKEHEGFTLATATRGETTFHTALLGDTLVVSDDQALLVRAVDVHVKGGEGSLGRSADFTSELARLPADAAAYEWYDLAQLRERTDLLSELPPQGRGAVDALLEGTSVAPAIARATQVPGGDLYQLRWDYSRHGADLFADAVSPPLGKIALDPVLAYAEVRDFGRVVRAWEGSDLRRKLEDGPVGQKIQELLDAPESAFDQAMGMAEVDPDSLGLDAAEPLLDPFLLRFGLHMASTSLERWLAGDAAVAVDWDGESEEPRLLGGVRLGTEARLFMLAIQGALEAQPLRHMTVSEHGGRTIVSSAERPDQPVPVHWTTVGDLTVLATDLTGLRALIDGAESPAAAPAADGFPVEDRAGYAFVDLERLGQALEASGASEDPDFAMFAGTGGFADSFTRFSMAGYVPDDFSRLEARFRIDLAPDADPAVRTLIASQSNHAPRTFNLFPEKTFLFTTGRLDFVAYWKLISEQLATVGMDPEQARQGFRETFDLDLEEDLLASFGDDFAMGVTYVAADPDAGSPPIPGFALALGVKDDARARRVVERMLEVAEEAHRSERMEGSSLPASARLFLREAHGGTEVVSLDLPPEERAGMPIAPALAFHDGFLLMGTDVGMLKQMIDGSRDGAPSFGASALAARARKDLGGEVGGMMILDWDLLLSQVEQYAEPLGGMAGAGDVPFPEFPEDGDAEEWQRRVEAYQRAQEEAAKGGADKVRKWIDAARIVDYVGSRVVTEGDAQETRIVVRFR